MSNQDFQLHRRRLLQAAAIAAGTSLLGSSLLGRAAWAQSAGPIKLGALLPLTGAGGPYGGPMAKVVKGVVDEVNAAGGIKGRKIELFIEDDQTNAEAGVRAAHKLIDVNQVAALMGTWASAVTTAVAPLCWESKTFLTTTSGADSITLLPHQGYLLRTQPNTSLQGQKFGAFAVESGAKRVFFITPQTPFVKTQLDGITASVSKAGGAVGSLVYDDKRPSYRSEVDEILRFKPDAIIFGGYTPDTTVMLKDLLRAGYDGKKIAFAYAINQKLVESVPANVVEGAFTIAPSPSEGSNAYARAGKLAGMANPDPYSSQIYDQVNLVILALAAGGGDMNGTTIKNSVRSISQGAGNTKVDNAVDGMKLLAAGTKIDYDGASGPCDFTDIGDIVDCKFRYEQVVDAKFKLLKIA
jgi:branched-chain amino acid transport system substrate-binding protein